MSTIGDIFQQWDIVYGQLEKKLPDRFAMRWIGKLVPDKIEDDQVSLFVPSPCIQELVKQNYAHEILSLWQACNPLVHKIDFKIQKQDKKNPSGTTTRTEEPIQHYLCGQELSEVQETSCKNLDPACTFKSFVVGKPNEFAYAAAKRVAEDDRVSFNPLYFHSPPGLGKTHLMQAIAWRTQELYPKKNVMYLSSEEFVNQFVKALRTRSTCDFQDMFRAVDVLMVDDIQFICGKKASQEEFFHTFNALIAQGKQIVLSADTSPSDLQGIEERLKTRLAHGLVVDIHPTSYELRLGILQEKIQTWHVDIPEDVVCFLAEHITANVRELEGALKRLMAHVELMNGVINLETTKLVLKDILGIYEKKVSVEEIQKKVIDFYHIKMVDLKSTRRERRIARPRQIAMYLAKNLTTLSLPEIACKFDRDHTTVLHAVKTLESLIKSDPQIAEEVLKIKRLLTEGF